MLEKRKTSVVIERFMKAGSKGSWNWTVDATVGYTGGQPVCMDPKIESGLQGFLFDFGSLEFRVHDDTKGVFDFCVTYSR